MSTIDPRVFYANPPQGKPIYVRFAVPQELAEMTYNVVSMAKQTGVVKRGSNETTKMIERGLAKLVVIAEDVDPPEIVCTYPYYARRRGCPTSTCPVRRGFGKAVGLASYASSVAIVDPGQASKDLEDLVSKLNDVRVGAGLNPIQIPRTQPQAKPQQREQRERRGREVSEGGQ
jgi:LSU ribosomal protein L7AE